MEESSNPAQSKVTAVNFTITYDTNIEEPPPAEFAMNLESTALVIFGPKPYTWKEIVDVMYARACACGRII